jgi:hypothetical protein
MSNVYLSVGNTAITSMTFCNTTSNAIPLNVYVVPNGFSADTSHQMFSNLILPAGDTYQIYQANEKLLLSAGDTVQANATANGITTITSYTSI